MNHRLPNKDMIVALAMAKKIEQISAHYRQLPDNYQQLQNAQNNRTQPGHSRTSAVHSKHQQT